MRRVPLTHEEQLDEPLQEALRAARRQGFLGALPLDEQVAHSSGFAICTEQYLARIEADVAGPKFVDLGSGGGLPGLVLAATWPRAKCLLLDSSSKRTAFLSSVVATCGWTQRVRVLRERAELAGRDPELRSKYDLVVARSFGPPPVTAECGAPFLKVGGLLVVSEPPEAPESARPRWPAEGLDKLGLTCLGFCRQRFGYVVLRQERPCPSRFPRRVGIPSKRPLYQL